MLFNQSILGRWHFGEMALLASYSPNHNLGRWQFGEMGYIHCLLLISLLVLMINWPRILNPAPKVIGGISSYFTQYVKNGKDASLFLLIRNKSALLPIALRHLTS